jgi:enoyl-CoA hydratase
MAHESPALLVEVVGSTVVLRFNRPAERNPLSSNTLLELKNILDEVVSNDALKAIIFTGTDEIFLSGANIRELTRLDSESAIAFSKLGQSVLQTIADAKQTTIAAVNGFCMGGGLDLALACDIRIGSEGAVFSHPGAKLGIITGWGGTQRLPQIIGKAAALEMMLTARRMGSSEALRLGLLTSVCEDPLQIALSMARAGTNGPPSARFSAQKFG